MQKTTKIIISVTVCLCIILACIMAFAKNYNPDSYKDKNGWIHNDNTSVTYETDANIKNTYAIVSMDKNRFINLDAHGYIELIAPILNGYSNKHYTTIMFEDGTGIYCPGSSIDNIAFYGEINETGTVTQEIGQIKVTGTTIAYTESSVITSVESKDMYQYLPEKYQTDNGSVAVIDNKLYVSVGIDSYAKKDEAYIAAEEVLSAFSEADLERYDYVEIVVNNEFVFQVIDNTLVF